MLAVAYLQTPLPPSVEKLPPAPEQSLPPGLVAAAQSGESAPGPVVPSTWLATSISAATRIVSVAAITSGRAPVTISGDEIVMWLPARKQTSGWPAFAQPTAVEHRGSAAVSSIPDRSRSVNGGAKTTSQPGGATCGGCAGATSPGVDTARAIDRGREATAFVADRALYSKPPFCDTGTLNCSWKWCT
jgi:hypothetical protein